MKKAVKATKKAAVPASKPVIVTVTKEDLANALLAVKKPGAKTEMKKTLAAKPPLGVAPAPKGKGKAVPAGKAKKAAAPQAPSDAEVDRFLKGLAKVEKETRERGPDVLLSPRDANGSLVQAALEAAARQGVIKTEQVATGTPKPKLAGKKTVAAKKAAKAAVAKASTKVKFATEDLASAIAWGITWIKGHTLGKKPDFPPPQPPAAHNFQRVALFSDWGTAMYGSLAVKNAILADISNLQLVVHLGDTYYAGLPDEMQDRVIKMWPLPSSPAGAIHRSLNGNHEMYGSGIAYFNTLLPKLGQKESAFAFSNGTWMVIGLDTAYKDHNLSKQQADWLNRLLAQAKTQQLKVVVLSHHQLFDFGRGAGKKLRERMSELQNLDRVVAWYWGHEHHAALFEKSAFGMRARCLGHGGMPEHRKGFSHYPVAVDLGKGYAWKRFPKGEADDCPAGIVLDGPNLASDMPAARRQDFAPHGYVVLEFQGKDLFEEFWVVNWDGAGKKLVYREKVGAALPK